jgi:hypothetical protein
LGSRERADAYGRACVGHRRLRDDKHQALRSLADRDEKTPTPSGTGVLVRP